MRFRNISSIVAVSPAYFVHETITPRPRITKRVPRRSKFLDDSDFTADPRVRGLFQSRPKKPKYTPLPLVDEPEFQSFKSLLEENRDQ